MANQVGDVQTSRRESRATRRPTSVMERITMTREEYQSIKGKGIKAFGFQNRLDNIITNAKDMIGTHELILTHFYRQCLAELLGTFFLVSMGCSVITGLVPPGHDSKLTMSSILLGWGFIIASLVWVFASISGSFFNPAITIAMFLNRRIPLIRCLAYIFVQIIGAIIGAALHYFFRGNKDTTCATLLHREIGVDELMGFWVEFYLTFFLLLVVFACTDSGRHDHGGSHALSIGGAVIPLVNIGAELTGASMNPARSFGPAVIHGNWDAHWVYWLGPIFGAFFGGLVYDVFFSEKVIGWGRYIQHGTNSEGDVKMELEW